MEKIRVLLVDRREIYREGLAKLLENKPEVEVMSACPGDLEAIEKISELKPDVVLMDTELPEGECAEVTRRICQLLPGIKVLMLTDSRDSYDLYAAIRAGALGYVTKDITTEELIKAIVLVVDGRVIIGAPMLDKLRNEFDSLEAKLLRKEIPYDLLSEREREVLDLVAKGTTNKEISTTLFISPHTVKVHLHNITRKLHVRNRQEATALAIEEGLTHYEPREGLGEVSGPVVSLRK
ncbi:LuxR C-terminal-related transcriptional regulator [Chloroflexota bacterium]